MIIFLFLFLFSNSSFSASALWYNSIPSLTQQYPSDSFVDGVYTQNDPNGYGSGWFNKLYHSVNSRYPDPGECDATILPYYGCVGEGTIDSHFQNIIGIDKPCNFFISSLPSTTTCRAVGWIIPSYYNNPTPKPLDRHSFDFYPNEDNWNFNEVFTPLPICSDGSTAKLSTYSYVLNKLAYPHTVCTSMGDYSQNYMDCDKKDPLLYAMGGCNCPSLLASIIKKMAFCPATSPPQKSEQTAIKTNSLIAESNSKVGLVASVNTTNTALLALIYAKLDSIFKTGQGLAISKKKPPVEKSPFFDATSTDSSVINDLSQNETDVRVSIDSSKNSACPAPISFNAFNQSQSISYQPLCNFAIRGRSMVIAAARVASACIVLGIL
jgi:hypothetical protein